MKSIRSISFILCLIVIPLPCLAQTFEVFSVPSPEEMTRVELAALVSPEASSRVGDFRDDVRPGVDTPAFLLGPQDGEPLQVAVIYVPPPKSPAEEYPGTISDPLEPVNRAFFSFNDKLYFWALKPAASGYKAVIPEEVRVSIRNFFSNVTTPVRFVNCLLQANFNCAGTEALRFFLNTTVGVAGFFDPSKKDFKIEKTNKDFGQTLGVYGIGTGFYIVWPVLGPSSVRDTIGYVGDLFLDPQNYLITNFWINLAVKSYYQVNETSLTIGEYEDLKASALDPYTALKDAYFQYRQSKVKEK